MEKDRLKHIHALIQPETETETLILSQDDLQEGMFWGKPRYGHPEGKVLLHVREVLDNVERLPDICDNTRRQLRLATIVHDAFKHEEYRLSRNGGRLPQFHHATLAAEFLNDFVDDAALLNLVRWHDEAYYCWRMLRRGEELAHKARLRHLLKVMGDDIQLYYLFFKCDTCTGDKNLEPLFWFEDEIEGIEWVDLPPARRQIS